MPQDDANAGLDPAASQDANQDGTNNDTTQDAAQNAGDDAAHGTDAAQNQGTDQGGGEGEDANIERLLTLIAAGMSQNPGQGQQPGNQGGNQGGQQQQQPGQGGAGGGQAPAPVTLTDDEAESFAESLNTTPKAVKALFGKFEALMAAKFGPQFEAMKPLLERAPVFDQMHGAFTAQQKAAAAAEFANVNKFFEGKNAAFGGVFGTGTNLSPEQKALRDRVFDMGSAFQARVPGLSNTDALTAALAIVGKTLPKGKGGNAQAAQKRAGQVTTPPNTRAGHSGATTATPVQNAKSAIQTFMKNRDGNG